jgi:membrane fusion protein, multidrug efflux system
MDEFSTSKRRLYIGRIIGSVIVVGSAIAGLVVLRESNQYPRTDDAEVRANYIGIAPQVNGPIIKLAVRDNQSVKQGDLLFLIDPRPFEHALAIAKSDQSLLEQQILEEQRTIAAQVSAVASASAAVTSAKAAVTSSESNITAAEAKITRMQAMLASAEAEAQRADDVNRRTQPLLAKQFVTVDDAERTRTVAKTARESAGQASAQVKEAEAELRQASAQLEEAHAKVGQTKAQEDQAKHTVTDLDRLIAQRSAREAAVRNAELNLEYCRVTAPFDALVTNMNISEGASARQGQEVFTLIDPRVWYVVANYRETDLKRILPGMKVEVFLMSQPDKRFQGNVESVGFGVSPEDGTAVQGLPNVQRTLNWVHLATRFPVRIRMTDPVPELFRIGASAIAIVRGDQPATGK